MTLERQFLEKGFRCIIGVDEVGMGSLAGPVVACAVAVQPEGYENLPNGVRDSKLLSAAQRERVVQVLKTHRGIVWAVRWCSAATVDRLNIYQASRLAMRKAIAALPVVQKPMVVVDGNKLIAGITQKQRAIVKGDQSVWAIAAASILAKVYRDAMMVRYATRYPGYGFQLHKGYGTAYHRSRLAALGPSALHRKTFSLL